MTTTTSASPPSARRAFLGLARIASQAPHSHPAHPDRAALERLQLAKLRRLLKAICPANRFYTAKLAQVGISPTRANLESFTHRVPFTRKQDLVEDQLAHQPYGSNLTFPVEQYTRCHQTSGSTGEPLRWLDTPESWQHLLNNWRQIYGAAGVTQSDRFLFAFSFGPFIGFWSALEAAAQAGCFVFPGGSMTTQARLRALSDHRITVLGCTPTYALHLGEEARKEKLDLSSSTVRLIIVAGEPGGSIPATRKRLAELWPRARVFDHYGMTEVGPATYECPAQPGVLHVIESAYLAEVIDPNTGKPLSSGQMGELVLTTLDRVGSPSLRYRTGDLVKARPPRVCACGRHALALEGGILGRTDDMVVVRGVNVFPSAVEEIVRRCGVGEEFQVHLDCRGPMPELVILVEQASDCSDASALAQRLQQAFQTTLALRVPVRTVPLGTLPRSEMKSKRWVKITG